MLRGHEGPVLGHRVAEVAAPGTCLDHGYPGVEVEAAGSGGGAGPPRGPQHQHQEQPDAGALAGDHSAHFFSVPDLTDLFTTFHWFHATSCEFPPKSSVCLHLSFVAEFFLIPETKPSDLNSDK